MNVYSILFLKKSFLLLNKNEQLSDKCKIKHLNKSLYIIQIHCFYINLTYFCIR